MAALPLLLVHEGGSSRERAWSDGRRRSHRIVRNQALRKGRMDKHFFRLDLIGSATRSQKEQKTPKGIVHKGFFPKAEFPK
eukprot:3936713-Amphidinium_carterae.1